MSEREYAAHRRRLTAVFALRLLGACAIVYLWDGLDSMQKVVAIVAAAVVVPGLGTVRRLLVPYARYVRDGAARPGESP